MNITKKLVALVIGLLVLITSTPFPANGQKPPKEREIIVTSSGKPIGVFDEKRSLRVARSVQILLNTNGKKTGTCLASDLAKETLLIGKRRGFVQVVYNLSTNEIKVTRGELGGPSVELGYNKDVVTVFGISFPLYTIVGVVLPETSKTKVPRPKPAGGAF